MGIAQRGKSRKDRVSPSRKEYVEIKVDGKREYLHRYNYRMAHGLDYIPPDLVIHHKDEVKRNNAPDNLEAKHRRDHMPRHHRKREDWLEAYEHTDIRKLEGLPPKEPDNFDEFGW